MDRVRSLSQLETDDSVLKKELEETGLFSVTVVTAPSSDQDFSGFEPNLDHYQAIVMNYDAPDWPADLRARFEKYVSNGGGLIIVHAANNAFPNWPAYNEMIGIGGGEIARRMRVPIGMSRMESWYPILRRDRQDSMGRGCHFR